MHGPGNVLSCRALCLAPGLDGKPCFRDRRQRGKDTGIPSVWGQETEEETRPLKQACLCTSPSPQRYREEWPILVATCVPLVLSVPVC
jgi:hypothetical protein